MTTCVTRVSPRLLLGALASAGCRPAEEPVDTGLSDACEEALPETCDYPSPGLAFTEHTVSVTEPLTGRELPLRVRLPEGEGPLRVVIYAHGGGLDDEGHRLGGAWAEALATHGYVTLNIGHATLGEGEARLLCEHAEVPEEECGEEAMGEDSGMVGVLKALDVRAVLDALPELAELAEHATDGDAPEVDLDGGAVMGWSAGSRAAVVAGGAGVLPTPSAPVYEDPDPRIVSLVAFSPTGPGFGGFFATEDETSWDGLLGPSLMITGDNDVTHGSPELTGEIRRLAWSSQPADGSRRLLYSALPVGHGGHDTYNLADLDSEDPELAALSLSMRAAVRAHLDQSLAGSEAAAAWLGSDAAVILGGDVDWALR